MCSGFCGSLQRGRALSSAEVTDGWRSCAAKACFNGAALFRARRCRRASRHHRRKPRFNGAALFRARRSASFFHPNTDPSCFNGAALFRARRSLSSRPAYWAAKAASTGPRSFERGGERWLRAMEAISDSLASTGPRSFERGGHPALPEIHRRLWRFNGAALFRARRCCRQGRSTPPTAGRFNGAALFRARRCAIRARIFSSTRCFNGAALFRARRCAHAAALHLQDYLASTGPRSFERGGDITPD